MFRTVSIALFASACAPAYDEALLDEYRSALPNEETTQEARAPSPTVLGLGDVATFPAMSAGLVIGVNTAIKGVIVGLRTVTEVPPTSFDASTREFVWGPWDDGEFGTVAVYVKETPGEDFRYAYALLRGTSQDLETLEPVIVGAATPDPTDRRRGVGVTLWDLEANRAFLEENGQPVDHLDRGRFVAVYGRGADVANPDNELAFVVSAFRDWRGHDQPEAAAVDLDYLHGRYWDNSAGQTVDFLDYHTTMDIDRTPGSGDEDLDVRMAFIDHGIGRAQAGASGGTLGEDEAVLATECWDDLVRETYLSAERVDAEGNVAEMYRVGEPTDCEDPFQATLEELEVPTILDVDAGLLSALDTLASEGVAAIE